MGTAAAQSYTRAYYENTEVTDPAGQDWQKFFGVTDSFGYRAYRGGDWKNGTSNIDSVMRIIRSPGKVYGGFRIVVTEE